MSLVPISALTLFTPLGRMIVPVMDPELGPGLKNGGVTIDALVAVFNGDAPGETDEVITGDAAVTTMSPDDSFGVSVAGVDGRITLQAAAQIIAIQMGLFNGAMLQLI